MVLVFSNLIAFFLQGSPSGTDDLDESITSALRTANQLKKMSHKMKASLKGELARAYMDSAGLSNYLG